MSELTQKRLRELLQYDPETGIFVWRVSRRGCRAGSRAGCIKLNDTSKYYFFITLNRKGYRAHRLAWLYMTGEWPPNEIDHRDGNGLNNIWKNLRIASRSQNSANMRISTKNTTGFKGVSFQRKRNKYCAQIRVQGRRIFLGRYDTPEEAHASYVVAAEKYFGEFARTA